MKKYIDKNELLQRIELNFNRLHEPYYQLAAVFSPKEYTWQGDKEGRALLAFVSHYKISGRKVPCMEEIMQNYAEKANEQLYLGKLSTDIISEQQLSGHSWVLRGFCEYHEQFHDEFSLKVINSIVENLYLTAESAYDEYPIDRENVDRGGVSGTEFGTVGKWLLSTDICCAFMAIDGLSHAYKINPDSRVKNLIDKMIDTYLGIDKIALRAQTHCTLSAGRGMMRMYTITKDEKYLSAAKSILALYSDFGGMTYTYQNLNWWQRPTSWTEPCAIIDSLMLALEIYKASGEEKYRTLAARVYHNGFSTLQRANGGAGTDSIVFEGGESDLFIKSWEAPFCCTMRLAEGLWYINENVDLLYADYFGEISKNTLGIYTDGDIVFTEVDETLIPYASDFVEIDGHKLCPIVKYYNIPGEIALKGRQKIVF